MNRAIVILCVLGAVSCLLCSCKRMKSATIFGQHKIEIIETGVLSCTSTRETRADGTEIFTYKGRNLKITFENEVLMVNGKRYVIPEKDDFIKIKDESVEINGKPAKPEEETSYNRLLYRREVDECPQLSSTSA